MENHGASRRQLLKMAAAGVAAMAAAPESMLGQSAVQEFPAPETPEQAMHLLLEGNDHYLKQQMTECSSDFAKLRHDSEEEQKPFAAVLCCSDSRVPAEIIFDRSIGHLFVVRVAGNVATPDTIASLEYAVAVLGVKAIVVVGHTKCGAVTAAKHGGVEPGEIAALFQYIYPATLGTADAAAAIIKNAQVQAAIIGGASTLIAERVKDGRLSVQPALYDLGTGKVTTLPPFKS